MADPYVGEIRMFAGNFAPNGWALCNGQLLPIAQNTALFSLLGTQFGGNGVSNFALPNLQASVPMGQGNGPGLTPRGMGEVDGEANHTLLVTEMPAHNHAYSGENANAALTTPAGNFPAANRNVTAYTAPGTGGIQQVTMSPFAVGVGGNGQPHNNQQPFLVVTFIIALQGVFPPRG
jgi:microcystin-dependent protein